MKGIGIIGLGSTVAIANFHEKGIRADGRIKISAVYDVDYDNAVKWVEERGLDCVIAKDLDELLANCDVVDICSPNFTHCDYVVKALEAGKHVFVEKPPALNAEEAKREVEAVEGKNLVNMVGYIYRYSNAMIALKKFVRERIGKIYTYSTYYGGRRLADPRIPLEWRFVRKTSGSGAIADFGSHVVDIARFITGEKIEKVTAMKNTFIPTRPENAKGQTVVENDDACVFGGVTENGILISATVSRVGMDDMRVVIAGEGGMVSLTMRESDRMLYWEKQIGGAYTEKVETIEIPGQIYFDGWFETEMREFIDALSGENVDYPTLEDGYYVEKVLAAIEKAADEKREIKI